MNYIIRNNELYPGVRKSVDFSGIEEYTNTDTLRTFLQTFFGKYIIDFYIRGVFVSNTNRKETKSISHTIMTVIGTVLCLILTPILLINLTLIAKNAINSDEVPSVGGLFPMIVLTDSMYPGIESGDLIICHTIDAEDVQIDDVISFYDPMGNGTSVVTHRVIDIKEENGHLSFVTKGDNNNTQDQEAVPEEKLLGVYQNRIPGAGNVAMFIQTTPGFVVCCVCPIVLIVAWDAFRRRQYETAKQKDTDALLAELEVLRAMKEEQKGAANK